VKPRPFTRVALLLFALAGAWLTGCRSYTDSTPRTIHEGDSQANYRRVFGTAPQWPVKVVNSVVVTYARRPAVVTTDDFEFELLVPPAWVEERVKRWHLMESTLHVDRRQQQPIRSWYAPKDLASYRSYRDRTSVGYVHLLVERELETDGRVRVFVSKH
jgi:hypothetical protein